MRVKQNVSNNSDRKPGNTTGSNKRIVGTSNASRRIESGNNTTQGNNITAESAVRSTSESDRIITESNPIVAESTTNDNSTDRTGTRTRTGSGIDNTPGTRTGTRTGANGNEARGIIAQNNQLDAQLEPEPLPKLKRKYTKRTKSSIPDSTNDLVRLAILTAINTTANTIFNTVAIFTKDSKWKLESDESVALAQDLDAALALLPETQYELIVKYLSTIAPLASLAATLGGIIKKRIETTKPANTNSGTSKPSNTSVGEVKPSDVSGDWRFNPAYTITGANH